MDHAVPLTNTERRDDVLFLVQRYEGADRRPTDLLDDDDLRRFKAGDAHIQRRLFFRLLCYGALAAQPAPEALVRADWQRLRAAGLPDDIFDRRFDVERFAARLAGGAHRQQGACHRLRASRASPATSGGGCCPGRPNPRTVVDVLYACSGGALKSRAFWVVREMLRYGLWQPAGLDRFACVPDGRVRKRAARIGLVDLDEKADTIDDMKAMSAALHAAFGLGGNGSRAHFDLPVSLAEQRCEICDRQRMAECPMPHCRNRRSVLGAD